MHISGWKEVVRRRLDGELMRLPVEGDWPELGADASEAARRGALGRLEERHQELLAAVKGLHDARLEDTLLSEATERAAAACRAT
ncbi:MAG: hypothetical protein WKF30_02770 [Pyrinomonadaceae bacterium]